MASGRETLYLFMTITGSSVNLMPCRASPHIDDTLLTIACHCSDTSPYIQYQHAVFVVQRPVDGFADFAQYRQQISLRTTFYSKSRSFEIRCFLETFPLQICSRFFRNANNVGDSSPLSVLVVSNSGWQLVLILKKEEVRKTHVPSQTLGTISSASGHSGGVGFLRMLFEPLFIPAAAMYLSSILRDIEGRSGE